MQQNAEAASAALRGTAALAAAGAGGATTVPHTKRHLEGIGRLFSQQVAAAKEKLPPDSGALAPFESYINLGRGVLDEGKARLERMPVSEQTRRGDHITKVS